MSFKCQANKLPGISTPLSPQGLITTTTPTFVWTAASLATEYNLQVQVHIRNNIYRTVVDEWFDAFRVANGFRCSAFLPLQGDDVVYVWRIRAHNDKGDGPWSSYRYFETVCAFSPSPTADSAQKRASMRQSIISARQDKRSRNT